MANGSCSLTTRWAELNGLPANDHFGRTMRDVLGQAAIDVIGPIIEEVLQSGVAVTDMQMRGSSQHGTTRSVLASYYPVDSHSFRGIGIVIHDVSQRVAAEQEMQRSELRYRSLVAAAAEIVWSTDASGMAVDDSASWRRVTGQTYEQFKAAVGSMRSTATTA